MNMKTSLQRLQTKDGIELVGLMYEPDAGSKEILVHVHGMSGNFYENTFLDAIAKKLTDTERTPGRSRRSGGLPSDQAFWDLAGRHERYGRK